MAWECGIDGCGKQFDDVESAVAHQVNRHERRECKVCGTIVPDGYPAIHHTFTEHSRAEYVRAYGASSGDVRHRETILEEIESMADISEITTELEQ